MTRTVRIPPAAAAIAVVFTLAYAVHALVRHWSFGSSGFDLGIFDQAIWHLSRFERPASTVGGYANIFGDHFHPILLLLVPLYSAWPAAETLLVAQAALLGASTIPVFLYARLRVGDRTASAFAIAYGLFWGMQKAAAFDFHEIAFAPLLIGTAILAVETGRLRLFWAAAVALCLVKEDLIPVVAMFALRLAVLGHIRHAAAAAAVALFGFAAVMQFVIPWVKGNDVYAYQSVYSGLSLWNAPARLFTPPGKMMTVVMWLAPFAFLPLRSPLLLLALPLALARLLSNNPNHWGTAFHYGAPLAPILATAAADGISRIRALAGRERVETGADRGDDRVQRDVAGPIAAVAAVLPRPVRPCRRGSDRLRGARGHSARRLGHRTGRDRPAPDPPGARLHAR